MSEVLNLTPERVFYYFNEIAKIPHGSRNTKQISDYLVDFAKGHGLKYRQDKVNNVIIWKDGKGDKPVIIQGHMDMVCEKAPDCNKDMEKEGLDLYVDDGYVRAKGTTLGGDDGVAVAMALALLESDDEKLPPLEVIITVDEEIGMLGAAALDTSDIKGRIMLNMDSEDEGIFTVSCAGGVVAECSVDIKREDLKGDDCTEFYKIEINGLKGGHSGIEINKNRANAIRLMGRTLQRLRDDVGIRLVDICGGAKDNAIAVSSEAIIAIDESSRIGCTGICELCKTNGEDEETKALLSNIKSGFVDADTSRKIRELTNESTSPLEALQDTIEIVSKDYSIEYATTDSEINITISKVKGEELLIKSEMPEAGNLKPMTLESTNKVIYMLSSMPNGIIRMSPDVDGLVQTSLNMGILKSKREVLPGNLLAEDRVELDYCVRSSVASEKDMIMRRLRDQIEIIGGSVNFVGSYPGWQYAVESPLRDLIVDVYTEQIGKAPEVVAIHAGVECGYFADKLPGLDCVSYGPNLKEIHTFREAMEIESVKRTYELTLETLYRLAE